MERGSEWRVWDLHFHTPASYDYKDKSVTNEQLVEGLVNNGVSVVAVTDHYVIDVPRIKDLQEIGKANGLTVFPGIEFCSELGGRQAVHFIALFSPDANLESIWTKIQGQCNLTPADIEQKGGYERICCDFVPTCDLILSLGGIITVHGGSKANSIEEIKNNLLQKQELKRQLLSIYRPILDCGKPTDAENYHNIVFPNIDITLPVIISSDNHDIKDYNVKCKTWVKADCTFAGLKQVLYEPSQRVVLSEIYPETKNTYSVIDRVELNQDGLWNQTIYLNPNLNTIIGGRSTGKSNLLSCIAANLNHSERAVYNDYVLSVKDSVKVVWRDGEENHERKIDYLPQNYIYSLMEDKKELNNLLFMILLNDQAVAKENVMYQAKCNDQRLATSNLLNRLMEQKRLLTAKVQEVQALGDSKGMENEILSLKKQKDELEKRSEFDSRLLKSYEEENQKVLEYAKRIEQLSKEKDNLDRLSATDFLVQNPNISYDGIGESSQNEIKKVIVDMLRQSNQNIRNVVIAIKDNIEKQRSVSILEKAQIETSESYKQGMAMVATNKMLMDIRRRLNEQEQLLAKVNGKKEEHKKMLKDFAAMLDELLDAHISFLTLTQTIASVMHVEHDDVKLHTSVVLEEKLKSIFEVSFNLKYKEMGELMEDLLAVYQSQSPEQLKEKLTSLVYNAMGGKLTFKGTTDNASFLTLLLTNNWYQPVIDVEYDGDSLKMMSPGKQTFVILKLLLDFSTDETPVLIDQPEDNLDNRAIYKELVMYLRKKKIERQIILVTHNPNIVVGADAENVIVANQDGVKTPNEDGLKFQYANGSLENSSPKNNDAGLPILKTMGIREHVCDILEGGEEAFRKRESKYGFARI